MFSELGKVLIVVGAVVLAIGLILTFLPSLKLGRLPGDIMIRKGNWRVYFPIVTSILLSLLLTLIFWLISLFRK